MNTKQNMMARNRQSGLRQKIMFRQVLFKTVILYKLYIFNKAIKYLNNITLRIMKKLTNPPKNKV